MPTVQTGQIGAYGLTLTASTVTEVDFVDDVDVVEIITDGAAAVYATVDGSAPTVGGGNCYYLPAVAGSKEVHPPSYGGTVVKLISSGTPTVGVAKV
jgi:hypothetical protein